MMWRGIELQGTNSTLKTNNISINVATEIADAQYGVLVQNGANYIVWKDVIFKNNFIGMQVNGPTFQTRFVTETKFTCNADLLPMYPGQSPQVCSRSYAGMELNNVFNGINIGDATNMTPQVTFEYLNIGILSRFSNPSIF
ncbi:MAG: hypothetical protein IPN13_04115 [Bacteroidetes bacterium]|nr:hypothetical protein [Bacteroidota bacterium]